MPFDLPALYLTCVRSQAVGGAYEEDGKREKCEIVDYQKYEKMCKTPDWRAKVGREVAAVPDR